MNATRTSTLNCHPSSILWLTPQDVDAIRLQADYERLSQGKVIATIPCALGRDSTCSCGRKTEPMRLPDESIYASRES